MKAGHILVALVLGILIGAALAPSISPLLGQSTISRSAPVTSTATMKLTALSNNKPLAEVAVRVERSDKGKVMGTLVANVDGEWVPVVLSSFSVPAR